MDNFYRWIFLADMHLANAYSLLGDEKSKAKNIANSAYVFIDGGMYTEKEIAGIQRRWMKKNGK